MHLFPPIDLGDQLVRLPLSDAAAMRLADVWLTDDSQQRRQFFGLLLLEQPTLCLWVSSHLDRPAHYWSDLVEWCETASLTSWLDSTDYSAHPLEATEPQLIEWSELAVSSLRTMVTSSAVLESLNAAAARDKRALIKQWLVTAATHKQAKPAKWQTPELWLDSILAIHPEMLGALSTSLEKRIRDEWLGSSRPFSNWLYRIAEKLRKLSRLETSFEHSVEEEKLAALKEFAYGASHEINNPLANISTRAQTMLREERDPERRRKLATINSQAFRAHEMISDLMLFAQPPQIELQPVNLSRLLDRVVDELAPQAAAQGTVLTHRSSDNELTLMADPAHLAVALRAICINALEALAMGGRVAIWSRRAENPLAATNDQRPWIEIGVHDCGPGISAKVRRHMFDPYFSGREAGRGLGLGLSKSWRIVNLHAGQIDVASDENGTKVSIFLPAA